MKISRVSLVQVALPLKEPFVTSWGTVKRRASIVVEVVDEEGLVGWGECVAFAGPWYTEETIETAWHVIRDFLAPLLWQKPIGTPEELSSRFSPVRGNLMAKAGVESAIQDLYAKRLERPLAQWLGGDLKPLPLGAAVAMNSVPAMLAEIDQRLAEGYRRIKLKIGPGKDLVYLEAVRDRFPDLELMADANGAYSRKDFSQLRAMDHLDLKMLEQPLAAGDWFGHRDLQNQIHTPICLDESIRTEDDLDLAIGLKSCQVINLKWGRVGGLYPALRMLKRCQQHGIAAWCGGMLESGIGRGHSLALSTVPGVLLPGDVSAANRYWEEDIVTPEATLIDGYLTIPNAPGIGYALNRKQLERVTVTRQEYRP